MPSRDSTLQSHPFQTLQKYRKSDDQSGGIRVIKEEGQASDANNSQLIGVDSFLKIIDFPICF
jgi:hypothetical protein